MEFNHRNNQRHAVPSRARKYAYCCFYNRMPSGNITLQQFETYAVERLRVLKAIELDSIMKGRSSDGKELKEQVASLGWEFLFSNPSESDEHKDFVSHHILRLAYAKSESKRQWFVTQEAELLRLRMLKNSELISDILVNNHFNYEPVPTAEVEMIAEKLNSCRAGSPSAALPIYYKVDFEEVLQLVAKRKIYLSQGSAYLPISDLNSFILNKYRMYLREQLAVVCKHLPGLEEENRIMRQLNALSGGDLSGSSYTGQKTSGQKITADMLDGLSLQSYPLCMQAVHNHLKTKHHLKHDGRMQYGLFLKGMGVSLEESLKFWRLQFMKGGVDGEKFDKNYAYNIRHNYGKEGKRTDYTPYSCMKIISRVEPKADECHGCPYKHSDAASLKTMLEKKKISTEAVEEILQLKKQGHYHVACMSLFKATHGGGGLQNGLQHPNQYFEESRAIIDGDGGSSANKSSAKGKTQNREHNDKENISELEDEFSTDM